MAGGGALPVPFLVLSLDVAAQPLKQCIKNPHGVDRSYCASETLHLPSLP